MRLPQYPQDITRILSHLHWIQLPKVYSYFILMEHCALLKETTRMR